MIQYRLLEYTAVNLHDTMAHDPVHMIQYRLYSTCLSSSYLLLGHDIWIEDEPHQLDVQHLGWGGGGGENRREERRGEREENVFSWMEE
jgi:hypothetical protein